jgi:hypothetical protein
MERKLCSCNRAYEQSLSGMCELCWNEAYPSKLSESDKDLSYWEKNAEENYMTTPISVLRYITELENALEDKEEKEESIQILKEAKEQATKQKTLEGAAEDFANLKKWMDGGASEWVQRIFKEGANWQAGRLYSEEEVLNILYEWSMYGINNKLDELSNNELSDKISNILTYSEWFEQFKKK